MSDRISKCTLKMTMPPSIKSFACIGGEKESQGPMSEYFDQLCQDPYFSQDTFEKGESQMQKQTIEIALKKCNLKASDIDFMFGGDLLNQCVGTTFGIRSLDIPFLGIYGACSTMAEGLLLSSIMVDNKVGKNVVATTSSHFCTAERQYRYPLDYGGQRTPTSQWTATASGAVIVSDCDMPPYVRAVTIGRIVDMGVTDANNMGAAMAPAAYETLKQFFTDTKLKPERFDYIVTGDLGKIGSKALYELLERDNIDISKNHKDCGMMIFDFENQDVHAGGSGCGCAASMLCGYFLPKLKKGEIKNILFMATGALLSPTINQQGESIPGIAHLVWISDSKGD